MIENGSRVSIEYTVRTEDGEVADTNVGGDPLVYEQGSSQILPALEQALEGLDQGDTKELTLEPAQGYGDVKPDLYEVVPADAVPEDARRVGAQLLAQTPQGQRRPVRVHELKGEEIVIDLNHPLAGQTLHFDIRVVGVE